MDDATRSEIAETVDAERREDEASGARFLLDGLGVDSMSEARMLVSLGRSLARAGGPAEAGTLRGLPEVMAATERLKIAMERLDPGEFFAAHGLEDEAVYRAAAVTAALTRVSAGKYAGVVAAVVSGISLGLLLAETES